MSENSAHVPPEDSLVKRSSGFTIVVYSIIFLWGMAAGREFLVPIAISALLAFLILPVTRYLTKHKFPEWAAISISTVVLVLPFISAAIVLVHEGQSLVQQLPSILKSADQWVSNLPQNELVHRLHLENSVRMSALSQKLTSAAGSSAGIVLSGVGSLLSSLALLVLVLIITVVMVASRNQLRLSAIRLLRQFQNLHAENMLDEVTSLIEQFLLARMAIMFIVGIAATILIFLFKVPYSILLGSLIGILTFVPEVGFILSILPLIVVSFAVGHSAGSLLALLGLIFVVHIIEGNVLTAKYVGHKLNINALASFVGLFGGGVLWGVWGMLLSIPIIGVVRVILCTSPTLKVWGDLLAEREDRTLSRKLRRTPIRLPLMKRRRAT